VFTTAYGDPAQTDQAAVLGGPLWQRLPAVQSGDVHAVSDDVWMLGIGVTAANLVLDDLESTLG
jgi:iron complex transport system substrate-binding protein